jgi:cobalamin biosynthesis Mg chelatase CobN
MERMKQQMAHAANEATMSESEWETAGSPSLYDGPLQETQLANISELENVLGEVTLVAQHYPGDQKILSAVGSVKQQLTVQIAALRRGDTAQKIAMPNKAMPAQDRPGSTKLDSAEKTLVRGTELGKETIDPPRPAEKTAAAAGTTRVAPSVSTSGTTPITAKTSASSLGDTTIVPSKEELTGIQPREQTPPAPSLGNTTIVPSQEQITNVRPLEQTGPAPTRVFREAIKSSRSVPGWLNIPAAVVAAILLVLIIYMVWRAT